MYSLKQLHWSNTFNAHLIFSGNCVSGLGDKAESEAVSSVTEVLFGSISLWGVISALWADGGLGKAAHRRPPVSGKDKSARTRQDSFILQPRQWRPGIEGPCHGRLLLRNSKVYQHLWAEKQPWLQWNFGNNRFYYLLLTLCCCVLNTKRSLQTRHHLGASHSFPSPFPHLGKVNTAAYIQRWGNEEMGRPDDLLRLVSVELKPKSVSFQNPCCFHEALLIPWLLRSLFLINSYISAFFAIRRKTFWLFWSHQISI